MLDKIKKNYFLLVSTFLILYFFFNLLDGERGLFSFVKKTNLLSDLEKQEIRLTNEINNLKFKNLLLTDKLDLDYIEILIRQKFFFGKNEEIHYIIKNNDN
tara:strand:+ start:225 stop:527 length:303 start_codon:yes stop_codon:yes gene_type:complete